MLPANCIWFYYDLFIATQNFMQTHGKFKSKRDCGLIDWQSNWERISDSNYFAISINELQVLLRNQKKNNTEHDYNLIGNCVQQWYGHFLNDLKQERKKAVTCWTLCCESIDRENRIFSCFGCKGGCYRSVIGVFVEGKIIKKFDIKRKQCSIQNGNCCRYVYARYRAPNHASINTSANPTKTLR